MKPNAPPAPARSDPGTPAPQGLTPQAIQAAVDRHPAVRAALARLPLAERAKAGQALGEAIAARVRRGTGPR